MKTCWLRRSGSKDCLLFVAGWGMGPEPFREADFGSADILMTYDYRSLDNNGLSALPQEGRLHLLAWSMGVWVAAWLAQHGPTFSLLRFSKATAIGGTLRPIDDQCGIPANSFKEMLRGFSPATAEAFYRSMFDGAEEAERFLQRRPQRSWEELRDELNCLHDLCRSGSESLPDIYSRRIITGRDRIVPARNQIRAWGRGRCEVLPLPHCPFLQNQHQAMLNLPYS